MKKTLCLSITEELYQKVREESFNLRLSKAKLIDGILRDKFNMPLQQQ